MRWPLALLSSMTLVALCSGCRTSKCEYVEQALRARDCDLRELRDEMEKLECYNKALQQEVRNLRGDVGPFPEGPDKPPLPLLPVRSLTLGRTGGYDSGTCPGDSALQVTLEPRDCDNHVVKVPGSAKILVLETSSEGTKKPLSEWTISPEQLRAAWRDGLFGKGYTLVLDWKVYPSTTKLRVVAQYQSADGRVFEADKDITVKVVPADKRRLPSTGAPKGGKEEDPFLPSVPPDPKTLGDPSNPETLPNPTPLDLGPNLPPPMPPPGGPSSSTSDYWGGPITGWTESTSGWGAPVSQPGGRPVPVSPPVRFSQPQPLRSGW